MSEEKKEKNEEKEDSLKMLAGIYYEELKAEVDREIKEPEYLAQAEFPNCSSRAAAITAKAKARTDRIFSLMILNHREGAKHGESYREERKGLEAKMSQEDISIARGFWKS